MASSRARRSATVRPATATPAPILPILLIVAAGASTYWNSLSGPFIWDDQTSIVTNRTIQRLWSLPGPLAPPRETPVAGRPIVNLSFAINYAFGGLTETGYHAWNIAVHIACALLLFSIVRQTLAGPKLKGRFGSSSTNTALCAALLWMLHPLQSEAVDYITQRTESMMALFFLLTLDCSIRARRSGDAPFWQVLAGLACLLGMVSKESMVTAPIIVVLYDRVFEFGSFREAYRSRKWLYWSLAATWIVLAAIVSRQPRSTAGFSVAVSPWTYLLNQIQMIGRYLRLTVWPGPLVLDYGLPRPIGIGDVVGDALIVLPLLLTAVLALFRWPAIGFLAVTFFVTLAPTSSVIPIASEVGAERRMYLPFAALAVLAAVGMRMLIDRAGSNPVQQKRTRFAATSVLVVVLILLAIRTIYRNAEYATPLSMWRTVVERHPHGRARMALATELITVGNHEEAMSQLREAVHDYPDARFGLGTELIISGRSAEGIEVLRQFIQDDPSKLNRIPALILMGQALTTQGKLAEAADQFGAVLKVVPTHVGARVNLADVLAAQGKLEEAATEYRALLATQPNNAEIETRLAITLSALGRSSDALGHFRHAHQVNPQSVTVNRHLAELYLRQNDAVQGEAYAREALRLDPRDVASLNMLGVALASKGQFDEAIARFRQALQINPNDRQAQSNLDRALRVVRTPEQR
jgi:tetratricopeptide (TPR) repeat protein